MKPTPRSIAAPFAAALTLLLAHSAFAATDTWSGGTDGNWGSTGNWVGGNATPANNDNLIFGANSQQNNTNNISNLTIGFLTFTNGGFALNGNALTVNPTSTGIFTNLVGVNIISNNLFITPAGKYWSVATNTELRLAGVSTNTSLTGTSAGWLGMTNDGIVRVTGTVKSERGMDLWRGTIIIDDGFIQANNDGIRFKPTAGWTAALQITNNGILRIGGGGNLRMGNGGTGFGGPAASGSLSRVDMSSGTLELYGNSLGTAASVLVGDTIAGAAGLFNQNGGLVWGSAGSGNTLTIGNAAGAVGTYNLNGGVLWIAQVKQGNASATTAVFNFNGGTLRPTASSATFFQGLLNANVQDGGAVIDTTNFNITIAQNLVAAGTGVGGLTKLGTGTLTLTGVNTYTGNTVISNGTLVTSVSSFLGQGGITIASNANLSVSYIGSTIPASTINLGSSVTNSVTVNFGASPTPGGSPMFSAINLNGTGVALINISGSSFASGVYPLIAFTNITGAASFQLGTLPLGLTATLLQTAHALSLNVALVPKNLEWSGAGVNWDTTSLNWSDLNNGNNPTNYTQSGGNGDAVTFDDNGGANPNVNIGITVTPSQLVMNNNANYAFSGTGKISGAVNLIKSSVSFGNLTINTTNDYSGGTLLQSGNLFLGNSNALGSGTVQIDGTIEELASASTANCTISNPVMLTTNSSITTLGDAVNTGTLALNGAFNFGSLAVRTLTLNSDVVLGGPILNSGGGVSIINGTGRLIVRGHGPVGVGGTAINQNSANVIIDGGTLNDGDAWRMQALNGVSLLLAVTNGGTLTITNAPAANLRVGFTGGDNSANNTLDIAGAIQMFGTGGNGSVFIGQSGATDTLNLRSGGTLICNAVNAGGGTAITTANFYGGTLTPIGNLTTFMQGLSNAYIWDGLTVDTTNFSVTIAQPLQAAGLGGLTKNGVGTLTLTGTNTYSGSTVVNSGKLALTPAFTAPGGIVVNANSTIAFLQTSPSATTFVSSVTIGSGTNSALEADLAATGTPAGMITNLILSGSVVVNVSGPLIVGQFPLFGYGTISGSGSLTAGQLPQGTIGHIVTNTVAKTIDLAVNFITQTIWTGATNANWDTTTTNWTSSGVPVAYTQLASVLFNDASSNAAVNLTAAMTPSSMVVSNNVLSYQYSGVGSLGGNMALTKSGTNSLRLNTANTYSGNTIINAGTIIAGNDTALGSAAGTIAISNGATLDMNLPVLNDLNGLGLQPITVSGSGVNGAGALVNSGQDENNAYRNVTFTGNTTIGGSFLIGLRTFADSDPGLIANGYNLTKVGPNQFSLNGGTTVAGLTNVWGTDIGNIDIKQGVLSFQRRAALGMTNNTITVEAGGTLQFFSLNQTIPVPINYIVMTNAILRGNGNLTGDVNTLAGPISLNGPTNAITTAAGLTVTANTVFDLNGSITGTGGAIYDGTINLGGVNTYTGPTVVDSATLTLTSGSGLSGTASITVVTNATFDVSALSPWILGANQTLGGFGIVNGSVQANGTISPGASIGTLTFNSDLTLAGTNIMYLDKDLVGQTNDTIAVTGALTYGGTLSVVLAGSTPLAVNDTFQLFSFSGTPAGSFSATNLPPGFTWDISQLAVNGTITVTGATSRPHPVFTSVTTSGGSIILSGTNAMGSYVLYSSTNLTLPLASWTPVVTNSFGGNFGFTNVMGAPQMFYLLQ